MKALLVLQKTSLCMLSGMLLFTVAANAQTSDISAKFDAIIETTQNPFDFALQVAESQGALKRQSKSFQKTTQGRALPRKSLALQYRKKFGGTAEQAQALRKILVAQYGEPKSIRGKSHVWDIENPNSGNGQADIVTIILKMGEVGGYELVMDRDKGGDGRATWAAPRMEPVAPKQKQQKQRRLKSILQPDND